MISVEGLTVHAGEFLLEQVGLEISAGEYAVLMGATGCGKTTLVECICGLMGIDRGRIVLDGQDVTHRRAAERNIGYVPQDGVLFPTMTVRRHLAFPLSIRKWKKADIGRRISELARLLSIEPLLDRRPRNLSGGEAQRVALGRALSFGPSVLILDEPLSALDDKTHGQMVALLRSITRMTGVTALHITHRQEEARQLADRIFLMKDGKINDLGSGISANQCEEARKA
jgi:ABC-type sugar transport system ATPase subunit